MTLTACATPTPTPDPDGPILSGAQALPKALATIASSETPVIQSTPTLSNPPTATAATATLTPTTTPMVGIFMGGLIQSAPEGTFTWVPTRVAKVIILTAKPGAKVTAPPGAPIQPGGAPIPVIASGGTARACAIPVAPQFAGAFAKSGAVGDRIGCPRAAGFGLRLVIEPFQNGAMVWRETREMFALLNTNTYIRLQDTWTEAQPADDPSIQPPAGLQKPVRGFGFAWRSNTAVRNGLGWALSGEQPIDGVWQDFERGFMITGLNGAVYALIPTAPDGGQHLGTLSN